jgi:hypothetical protein
VVVRGGLFTELVDGLRCGGEVSYDVPLLREVRQAEPTKSDKGKEGRPFSRKALCATPATSPPVGVGEALSSLRAGGRGRGRGQRQRAEGREEHHRGRRGTSGRLHAADGNGGYNKAGGGPPKAVGASYHPTLCTHAADMHTPVCLVRLSRREPSTVVYHHLRSPFRSILWRSKSAAVLIRPLPCFSTTQ